MSTSSSNKTSTISTTPTIVGNEGIAIQAGTSIKIGKNANIVSGLSASQLQTASKNVASAISDLRTQIQASGAGAMRTPSGSNPGYIPSQYGSGGVSVSVDPQPPPVSDNNNRMLLLVGGAAALISIFAFKD